MDEFDKDRSGYVASEEYFPIEFPELAEAVAVTNEFMRSVDEDRDGKISQTEFSALKEEYPELNELNLEQANLEFPMRLEDVQSLVLTEMIEYKIK